MQHKPERLSTWELFIGILVAEAGAALVGFGEWDPIETGARMPFYAAGLFLLAVGMLLIWQEPLSALMVGAETSPDGTASKSESQTPWQD